jgi:hypothetical protein
MKPVDLIPAVLDGHIILVAEFRGGRVEQSGFVDKITGEKTSTLQLTYAVERQGQGMIEKVILRRYLQPSVTPEEAEIKLVKGVHYAFVLDKFEVRRGMVFGRMSVMEPVTSKRNQLTQDVAGIDSTVLQYLYGFDNKSLVLLFRGYNERFGASAGRYALESFHQWKSGTKSPSAQTVDRFLKLVPPLLSFEQKFDLLKSIYEKTRSKETHTLTVILGHSENVLGQLGGLFTRLSSKPAQHTLSPRAQAILEWASDDDSQTARRLMVALETEESVAISKAGGAELDNLVHSIRQMNPSTVGTHCVELPYGIISVTVRHPTFFEKLGKLFS